ncbi:probable cytochrome P450 6a13 [Planococcus citri]|uniref:probable cytochrome P450 6a13 n=1 Tax=Planococcus citri TaxID=170843 RepID=UPI0031F901EE
MVLYNFIILIIVSISLYLYWCVKKAHLYFEKLGIPYIKPTLVLGNIKDVVLLRTSIAEWYADMYRQLDPHKLGGIFIGTQPVIMIRDPDLIRNILVRDFGYFCDRGFDVDPEIEPMSNHLFFMKGDDWKNLRRNLTSIFTTSKMKFMFSLVRTCGEKLNEVINEKTYDESLEAKDLFSRYTCDVIGSCVFGLDSKSLDNPNSEFRIVGKKIFRFRFKSLIRMLKVKIPKSLIKLLEITLMDRKTQNFFRDIIYNTVNYRERNDIVRNDLLDLLIALKHDDTCILNVSKEDEEDLKKFLKQVGSHAEDKNDTKITNEVMAAQALLFFLAGFETSSTNLTYVLLELAQNKHIQDKVRHEIHQVLSSNNDELNYDVLKQMTYTDMVIAEALRKYPPLALLFRTAVQNYQVPGSKVIIPTGTQIIISINGLHMDEKYFDNPQEFRPERFSGVEEEKSFTYLPFGDGPRYCIGSRFSKLTVKTGLIYALKNFSYRISPRMKFPLKFEKNFGLLSPSNEILLVREKITSACV